MIVFIPINRINDRRFHIRKRCEATEINNFRITGQSFCFQLHARTIHIIQFNIVSPDILFFQEVQNMLTERIIAYAADISDIVA